jgi:hypothetical protein
MTTSRRDFLKTAGVAAGALPALKVKTFHFSSQSEAV